MILTQIPLSTKLNQHDQTTSDEANTVYQDEPDEIIDGTDDTSIDRSIDYLP